MTRPSIARRLPVILLALMCAGLVHARGAQYYVGDHGWHTSIIVPRSAIPADAWPAGVKDRDFAGCDFVELGWGDRTFYMAKKPSVLMAIGAALAPNASVLHVVGYRGPISHAHVWTERLAVTCTSDELANLCRALGATFARNDAGHAQALGPGLYGIKSEFYAARGKYWIGNTCNSWTLRMERAGGLPVHIGPAGTLRASVVMAQTRRVLERPHTH